MKNDDETVKQNNEQCYVSSLTLNLLITDLCLALFLLGLDTAILATVSIFCHYPNKLDNDNG